MNLLIFALSLLPAPLLAQIHFLYGAKDCGVPVPMGLTWATKVRTEKEIQFVPNTPHGMFLTPEGREAIRSAIDKGTTGGKN